MSDGLRWYDDAAQERWVDEKPKRVPAPERTPFERDCARLVHAASSRRLAAKTQIMGPQSDDFVRNRLTHSLEVAQIGRDLARALGSEPDLVETAALAHDLGHPPFGHNGERVLAEASQGCGGFEGNAQTLRLLTRLEAKTFGPDGRSAGLNLTRATLDACTKYPWPLAEASVPTGVHGDGSPRVVRKFGVYDDDRPVFDWMRAGAPGRQKCFEAQVMDLADDIAYSVHDVEDGIVAGRVDLTRLDEDAVHAAVATWYAPDADQDALDAALERLRSLGSWPVTAYDGSRRALAALKNLTSDVIGRFAAEARAATFAAYPTSALVRYEAELIVPEDTRAEIAVLKGIAAHYVIDAEDRVQEITRQRELLSELVELLTSTGPGHLETAFADDWAEAPDDAARRRVVIDQVASLTDASAVAWHHRLIGSSA
jgi:dGTPase